MNSRVSSAPVMCFTNFRQDLLVTYTLDFPCIFSFSVRFPLKGAYGTLNIAENVADVLCLFHC